MTTLLTGLIGSGIGFSLSPAMHEREAALLGLELRYDLWDLHALGASPGDVGDLLRRARDAGYRGLNITHPCKQLVLAHLDTLSPDATAIGAVNTVVIGEDGFVGHNTDWTGFRRGLVDGLAGAPLDRVVLVGAGGAGAAAAYALLDLGTERLDVVDADPDRAARLAADLDPYRVRGGRLTELPTLLGHAHGVVHATPVGMAGHPGQAVPGNCLRPDLWVAEIVFRPLHTALLAAAAEAGAVFLDGGRMNAHQAADAFRLFTGLEPDPSRMYAHLRELVAPEVSRVPLSGALSPRPTERM
ncbi:shikimate dehydrogenase [Streptomyces asiaticus]|uniref:shikimate dehydrogenase n=1 Tax=Streptomyces asiaticus TaxID=114695 RepID=UPI0039BE2D5E